MKNEPRDYIGFEKPEINCMFLHFILRAKCPKSTVRHYFRRIFHQLGNEVLCLLLSESVLLLLAPHVHNLPVLVHLHGVIHQSVHVDELDALLLGIKQHGGDDRQLPHLLLSVLTYTQMLK